MGSGSSSPKRVALLITPTRARPRATITDNKYFLKRVMRMLSDGGTIPISASGNFFVHYNMHDPSEKFAALKKVKEAASSPFTDIIIFALRPVDVEAGGLDDIMLSLWNWAKHTRPSPCRFILCKQDGEVIDSRRLDFDDNEEPWK